MRSYLILVPLVIFLLACKKQLPVDPSSDAYIETDPPVLIPVNKPINADIGGYYIALPAHYQESSKKYPLLLFIHGSGQYGNGNSDLPSVLWDAIPELLDEKFFPASFTVNGKHYSFIVMMPQFIRYPYNNEVIDAITYAEANYRIDSSRVYLTGFSIGGAITGYVASDYASSLAAIVPIAGITGDSARCQRMINAKLPIWAFHNDGDEEVDVNITKNFISLFNSFNPAIPAKLTIFKPFGLYNHDAWTKATDPDYRENGKNMYEWMLQYSR